MASKTLPIELKPLVTSECWNYYKFAIMQTMPEFDVWLASHPQLYINQNGSAVYGESGYMHPLSYFSGLLEIVEKNIFSVPSQKIIEFIIGEIDKGNYIVTDVNYKKLRDKNVNERWTHEVFVYGYDTDEKTFDITYLFDGWKPIKVDFEAFEEAYKEAFALYDNRERIYNRRRFHFPITIITPKHGYTNANAYYDFINKLQRELEGNVYIRQPYATISGEENKNVYYTGLACMPYMVQKLEQELNPPARGENITGYLKPCLKLSEYQHMLLYSMKWFIRELQIKDEAAEALITGYGESCDMAYNDVLLFYKYNMKPDDEIIKRIIGNLRVIYTKEGEILEKLIPIFIEEYTSHLNNK